MIIFNFFFVCNFCLVLVLVEGPESNNLMLLIALSNKLKKEFEKKKKKQLFFLKKIFTKNNGELENEGKEKEGNQKKIIPEVHE